MDKKFENLVQLRTIEDQLFLLESKGWLEYEFLTWNWWILAAFFVLPWVIWFKLAKRESIITAVLFGAIIMIITLLLDVVGIQLSFWEYPTQFVPFIPRAFPFDISMVPVAYMLLNQYFQTWKTFFIAQIMMALIYAFIGEPFSEWAELVYYIKWNYVYSFVYYLFVGITTRLLIEKLVSISKSG